MLSSLLTLALAATAGAIDTACVYKPGHSEAVDGSDAAAAAAVPAISEHDAVLNLADDFGIGAFYAVDADSDAAELAALSLGKDDVASAGRKIFVVVNGVDSPETLLEGTAPVYSIELKDDRDKAGFVDFLSDASAKLLETDDSLQDEHLSWEIDVIGASAKQGSAGWKKYFARGQDKLDKMWEQLRDAYSEYEQFNSRKLSVISDEQFVREATQLNYFFEHEVSKLDDDATVVVMLDSLVDVYKRSRTSQTYQTCKQLLANLLQDRKDATIIALPIDQQLMTIQKKRAATANARKLQAQSQSPLYKREHLAKKSGKVGKCHASIADCEDSTDSCSGHGACSLIGECYTCICKPTVAKGLTTYWNGNSCEKEDVSSTFQLLFWTTLVLLFAMAYGVKFMYGCGSDPLPNVLQAATVQTKKSQ